MTDNLIKNLEGLLGKLQDQSKNENNPDEHSLCPDCFSSEYRVTRTLWQSGKKVRYIKCENCFQTFSQILVSERVKTKAPIDILDSPILMTLDNEFIMESEIFEQMFASVGIKKEELFHFLTKAERLAKIPASAKNKFARQHSFTFPGNNFIKGIRFKFKINDKPLRIYALQKWIENGQQKYPHVDR